MPLDAKREEWKGHGEEGKQIAQEEEGKEKPNGNKTKKRHKPASLSLCSEWYLGPPSFAQVLHPWQNDTIHRSCPRLLLSSEHCRPHCIHKNGMVFICIHVLHCSGTWTLLLCYSLRHQADRTSRILWKSSPPEKRKWEETGCVAFF